MGLFGFLGNTLGSQNTFHIDPMQLQNNDYSGALTTAQNGAIGSINAGNATGAEQATLAQQLQQQANGQGQSLAQLQLQQAAEQNIKNNAGLIASTKGINPAQAARNIAVSNASQGQNLANQSGQLRLQEQMQKQQLLANSLAAQRGQDINQQGANTQLFGTTGNLQNAQNQNNLNNYYNAANINSGIAAQNSNVGNQIGGGILNAGGGIMAAAAGVPAHYDGAIIKKVMERAAVSPGEKIVSPDGDISSVPGKARFDGDDPRNDTVIADLRKDSIVVPRSSSSNKENMINFIKHMQKSSDKKGGMQELLDSHNELKQKLEEINYKLGKWMPK